MLKKRTITALCLVSLIIVILWVGQPWWFTVLAVVWGLVAVFEFYRMTATTSLKTITAFGLVWTVLFIISPHFEFTLLVPLLLSSTVILPLLWLLLRPPQQGAFVSWAWTIAGILYVGWLLSYFVALRGLDGGRDWAVFALFTTFASDSAAYIVGKTLGRHPLAPHVSPNKTWEGTIGGVLGAIGLSLALVALLNLPLGYGQAVLLGLLVSILGQIGDLAESLLKRSTGVKDSGRGVPGHGGFLDRIDSVVFAGIVVYYYVVWVIL